MESSNAEEIQQHDRTDSSFEILSSSSSSTANSSYITLSTDCDYENLDTIKAHIKDKKKIVKQKRLLRLRFSRLPHENVKSYKTKEVSKKTVAKSKSKLSKVCPYSSDNCGCSSGCTECDYGLPKDYCPYSSDNCGCNSGCTDCDYGLSKDYCPYSSDNCGCNSGCTDCDYGLYTYTVKNKKKLKSKVKKLYVKSSNGSRPLKTSERSRRIAKSFRTNILRKKKTRFPKKKASDCYPESSGSYDCKSGYIKHDFELCTTQDRILKTKRKTLTRNSRKLKTMRTRKLRSKKVSKNAVAKIFEENFTKNWFPDSSNSYNYNSSCTDYEKDTTTKRKKLKNRSERTRASTNSRVTELSSVIDQLKIN